MISQQPYTCWKLTIKTLDEGIKSVKSVNNKDTKTSLWRPSGVFILNIEQISYLIIVFLLLNLRK